MAVIHGSTLKCFRHFLEADMPDFDKRKTLSEFTGVPTEPTIRRWFKGTATPVGEYLIRLRYFLDTLGYEVAELETLNPMVSKLGRILAYRLKTIDEIADALGYTSSQRAGQMLVVLHGVSGLSADKLRKAELFVETMRLTLDQETTRRRALLRVGKKETKELLIQPARSAAQMANGSGRGEKKLLLRSAARQVTDLTEIADFLLSDSCSVEDRKKLHELAGADSVLKLITRLRRLCSETARRQLKDTQELRSKE